MTEPEAKTNVVGFSPGLERLALGEPNPAIVDHLERLLAEALEGQIQGFCYVAVDHEGAVMTGYFGSKRYTQLGGIARLQHKINSDIDNGD